MTIEKIMNYLNHAQQPEFFCVIFFTPWSKKNKGPIVNFCLAGH